MCLHVLFECEGMSGCYDAVCTCVGVVSAQAKAGLENGHMDFEWLRFSYLVVDLVSLVHAVDFLIASFTPWILSWLLFMAEDHMAPFDLLPLYCIVLMYSGLDESLWDLNI